MKKKILAAAVTFAIGLANICSGWQPLIFNNIVNAEEPASISDQSEGMGIEVGNVVCCAGETVSVPLTLFGTSSQECQILLNVDDPLEISSISGAFASDFKADGSFWAVFARNAAYADGDVIGEIQISVSGYAEPGEYPINISVGVLESNGVVAENPIGINGTVTVEDPDPNEGMGIEVGNVACRAGDTVYVPLTLFGTSNYDCEILLNADDPLKISDISGALASDFEADGSCRAIFARIDGYANRTVIGKLEISVSDYAKPGEYPINISVEELYSDGDNVENPIAINGTVTVVDPNEAVGIEVGNVSCFAGKTVSVPLTLFGTSSDGCEILLNANDLLKISDISGAIVWDGRYAFFAASKGYADGEVIGKLEISVSDYAEPGKYPINISVESLESNGSYAENPIAINGTVTVIDPEKQDYPFTYEKVDEDDDGIYDCIVITSVYTSAEKVDIPSEIDGLPVTSIRDSAFYYCKGLTSIEIPSSVTSIGDEAFYGCSSLMSIEIPDGVTSIGKSAFENCSSLTSVEIPDGVTSIGNSAFENCSSLTSITIPNSVTSIGNSAFSGCTSLTSIEIPDSVTSIGKSAFYGCSGLTSITIENPECEISDDDNTICNGYDYETDQPYYNGVICGYENSTAQAYAEKYGYTFEVIGEKTLSISDLVKLQKYIMGSSMAFSKRLDLNDDGIINVIDAVLLRRKLIYG